MRHVTTWTEQRIDRARRYSELLTGIEGVVPPKERDNAKHVYHLYVVRCGSRDRLRDYLSSGGVPSIVNYPKALPFYPAYSYLRHEAEDFPVAFRHAGEILSLPMFPELTAQQTKVVIERIREFFG
jgi:dTDP-4-amino-4,6-dideoxygalactose transaminase